MFREVEIKVALQQELQRLKQEEKELLVYGQKESHPRRKRPAGENP